METEGNAFAVPGGAAKGGAKLQTIEERMLRIHSRETALREKTRRRRQAGLGGASLVLAALLVRVIRLTGQSLQSAVDVRLTGASLLSTRTGGYVLVAVVSFSAAVLLTVACERDRRKRTAPAEEDRSDAVRGGAAAGTEMKGKEESR